MPDDISVEQLLPTRIQLIEYESARLRLAPDIARRIFETLEGKVTVNWPSPATAGFHELLSEGWVGHFPLGDGCWIDVRPKVPVRNVFEMWEHAYALDIFDYSAVLSGVNDLAAFFNALALVLSRRIAVRTRKGLARSYLPLRERLMAVRGRLDVPALLRQPSKVDLACEFDDHTTNTEDNGILAYTLERIQRHPMLREDVHSTVRRTLRGMPAEIVPSVYSARDCVGRSYTRLTHDYQSLHALCRFFLSHTGPMHVAGSASLLPFSVDMAVLFEQFVAAWLRRNLPPHLELSVQEHFEVSGPSPLPFRIDLVIRERVTRQVLCVLDTKYKRSLAPKAGDIHQAVSYAEAQGCQHAFLIYPSAQTQTGDYRVNSKVVHAVAFDLNGDLDVTGADMLNAILKVISA